MLGFIRGMWQDYKKGRGVYFWRRVSYKLIQKLGWQEKFSAPYCGARFHPFNTSLSKGIWLRRERFGRRDLPFLLDLLRPGDCLLDIGGNIGTHSICPSKKIDETMEIHCFEPHPQIYAYLQKNILLNRLNNIRTYNVALGDTEGTVVLTQDRTDDTSWVSQEATSDSICYEVPLKRLDSYQFCFGGKPVIMKIDIEGYELYAFRGGEQTLNQVHIICLEVGDRHSIRVGYTAQELMRFLAERGWRLFRFENEKTLVEITPDYQPPDVEALVAARSIDMLRERLQDYRILSLQIKVS